MIFLPKLVRDKVIEKKVSEGEKPAYHIASDEEYWKMLKLKLREEAAEFAAMEKQEELADLLEVIHTIAEFKKIPFEEIEEIRLEKKKEKGGFEKKIVLEGSK